MALNLADDGQTVDGVFAVGLGHRTGLNDGVELLLLLVGAVLAVALAVISPPSLSGEVFRRRISGRGNPPKRPGERCSPDRSGVCPAVSPPSGGFVCFTEGQLSLQSLYLLPQLPGSGLLCRSGLLAPLLIFKNLRFLAYIHSVGTAPANGAVTSL